MPDQIQNFRGRLIAARLRLGVTQAEMSSRLTTRPSSYSRWENGVSVPPEIVVLDAESLADTGERASIRQLSDVAGRPSYTEVVAELKKGSYPNDIARQFGIALAAVFFLARKQGLVTTEKKRTVAILADLKATRLSTRAIAARHGVTFQLVLKIKKKNFPERRRSSKTWRMQSD